MTATYTFNGDSGLVIPGDIFTLASPFVISVSPTSKTHEGTYHISLSFSDTKLSTSSALQLTVGNIPPRLTSTFPVYNVSVNS
jgi:hypothetical protein